MTKVGRIIRKYKGDSVCNICGHRGITFEQGGEYSELYRKHNISGGGIRRNCICPWCRANDRLRWYYYVLSHETSLFAESSRVLHFAPERVLREKICAVDGVEYYSGDLTPGRAMHITDITKIQYIDKYFDYVICNHVLEHIPNEKQAVSEVLRVLKDDGLFIFSFPLCYDMKTYENPSINSVEERIRLFGQEDHVRLYGSDFKEHFEEMGLKLSVYTPEKYVDKNLIEKYGFISNDILILAQKLKA